MIISFSNEASNGGGANDWWISLDRCSDILWSQSIIFLKELEE
jgi:hypothetical protein